MADSDSPTNVGQQPALSVTVHTDGAATVVTVSGEIDLETSTQLKAVLAELDPDSNISVDLGDVTYIDSTGLRVLLTARDAADEAGGKSARLGHVEHRFPTHRDHRRRRVARRLTSSISARGS